MGANMSWEELWTKGEVLCVAAGHIWDLQRSQCSRHHVEKVYLSISYVFSEIYWNWKKQGPMTCTVKEGGVTAYK